MTFPNLPYLPEIISVALYRQTLQRGITAAGTVPDSHRIPLHQAASATRLPYFGGKGTNKQAENQIKAELFLDLSDILLIFANGNDKKTENK